MSRYNLPEERVQELSELASYYADLCCPAPSPVFPDEIAKQLGLSFSLNDYGNIFDACLEQQNGRFHVFLNIREGEHLMIPRIRFSFAHELGHYIIDEHRRVLLKPGMPSHGSFATFDSPIEAEREADLFAACLLMPEERIRKDIFRKKFHFSLIDEFSRRYQVSATAVILRFIALGNHPLLVVCSQDNKLKWMRFSHDFPFPWINLGPGNTIPELTCAGEYFNDKTRYSTSETVYAGEWFRINTPSDRRRPFNEYCIYQESINQVISVIWE
jgi:hypothetical protein